MRHKLPGKTTISSNFSSKQLMISHKVLSIVINGHVENIWEAILQICSNGIEPKWFKSLFWRGFCGLKWLLAVTDWQSVTVQQNVFFLLAW